MFSGLSTWLTGAASTVSSFIVQNGLTTMAPMVADWLTHESPFAGLLTGKETAEEFGEKVAETFGEESVQAFKDNWDANNPDANVFAQLGKNSILYWDMINKWQVQAEEYAQQQAELEQQRLEELQRKTEPTENWEFGEDWSMDEILQWVDRQNTQRKDGGNSGNQDGLTSADAKSMTDAVNKMPAAVQKGVSGLRVVMDGQTVGHIVAPYVSAAIATGIL